MFFDIKTILWKECCEFKKNLKNELPMFIVFCALIGVAAPYGILKDIGNTGILPLFWVMAGLLLFAAVMYAGFISEGSFVAEKNNNTLSMLLTTRIPPNVVFLGKWLALMLRSIMLIILAATLQLVIIFIYCRKNDIVTTTLDYNNSQILLAIVFGILGSSYTIAVNAALSLIVRDGKQLRQFSMLITLTPMIALWGFIKLFGVGWASVLFIGFYLFLLTIVSFVVAFVVFRSEKVRL